MPECVPCARLCPRHLRSCAQRLRRQCGVGGVSRMELAPEVGENPAGGFWFRAQTSGYFPSFFWDVHLDLFFGMFHLNLLFWGCFTLTSFFWGCFILIQSHLALKILIDLRLWHLHTRPRTRVLHPQPLVRKKCHHARVHPPVQIMYIPTRPNKIISAQKMTTEVHVHITMRSTACQSS